MLNAPNEILSSLQPPGAGLPKTELWGLHRHQIEAIRRMQRASTGLLLYFAGQGAGRVSGPFMAGSVRLLVAAGFGWVAVTHFGVGLSGLFWLVAFSSFLFGLITAVATRIQSWQNAKIP